MKKQPKFSKVLGCSMVGTKHSAYWITADTSCGIDFNYDPKSLHSYIRACRLAVADYNRFIHAQKESRHAN